MACHIPARLSRRSALRWFEIALWLLAAVGLGIFALVYLERTAYQAYEKWRFEREMKSAARAPANSADGSGAFEALRPAAPEPVKLAPGDLIGRIKIPGIGVSAMVAESTASDVLRRAVGHIEGTALPGGPGNAVFAGHRDTFFRGLRDIKEDDRIQLVTLGGVYEYVVDSIRVVDPDDVGVLDPSPEPVLTLVTCYPFEYVGAAPKRFVVRARKTGMLKPPSPGF